MNEEQYDIYLAYSIPNYAKAKSDAEGYSYEDALKLAKETYAELLPSGLSTEDHYLYVISRSSEQVGHVWLSKELAANEKEFYAWIYDIEIYEDFRGKGLSKEVMKLIEERAKVFGSSSIRLHVFGHNEIARSLYKKSGYIETNVVMKKLF